MGKRYKRYKNRIEAYLESEKGRRLFHITYSVGASIVLIGALFKINHLPYGSTILMIGLITEATIFFISAFDTPAKEYKWEDVYPALKDDDENDNSDDSETEQVDESDFPAKPAIQSTAYPSSRGNQGSGGTVIINGNLSGSSNTDNSTERANISASTENRSFAGGGGFVGSAGSFDSPNVMDASEKYAEKLSSMSDNMEKFAQVTNSLTEVSDILLNSFRSITDNSEGISSNTQGYVTQMESLNRNISGLNTIYEIQLKGISGQINTIEEINAGLSRIKSLYAGSLADSSVFKSETEKMAQQLAELNRVYARLLQAMTSNMNMGPGFNPNSQGGSTL